MIVEDLIDLIEKYDDIVGNLCGIDSLNEVISRKQGVILSSFAMFSVFDNQRFNLCDLLYLS